MGTIIALVWSLIIQDSSNHYIQQDISFYIQIFVWRYENIAALGAVVLAWTLRRKQWEWMAWGALAGAFFYIMVQGAMVRETGYIQNGEDGRIGNSLSIAGYIVSYLLWVGPAIWLWARQRMDTALFWGVGIVVGGVTLNTLRVCLMKTYRDYETMYAAADALMVAAFTGTAAILVCGPYFSQAAPWPYRKTAFVGIGAVALALWTAAVFVPPETRFLFIQLQLMDTTSVATMVSWGCVLLLLFVLWTGSLLARWAAALALVTILGWLCWGDLDQTIMERFLKPAP